MKTMRRSMTSLYLLALSYLLLGCDTDVPNRDLGLSGVTVVVAPFQTTGNAESGQYALQLQGFSQVLESELGAVSDWTIVEANREGLLLDELNKLTLNAQTDTENTSRVHQHSDSKDASDIKDTSDIKDIKWLGRFFNHSSDSLKASQSAAVLAAYPEADYMLLGQIKGFDIAPERNRSVGLSHRVNRIRSSIHVQVVDVQSRQWLASRTISIDKRLNDNSAAETQIEQAMQLAAQDVVSGLLLATAKALAITQLNQDQGIASMNGGAAQGVQKGMRFQVFSASNDANEITRRSVVEVIDVLPNSAVVNIIEGQVDLGYQIIPQPLLETNMASIPPIRLSIGGVFASSAQAQQGIGTQLSQLLQLKLKVAFQNYGDIEVMEKHTSIIKSAINQQVLDDLSKGREPGLPLGSLRGVDYLVFGTVSHVGYRPAKTEQQQLFGSDVTQTQKAVGEMDATVYMIDVNSGNYAIADSLNVDVDMEAALASPRLLGELSEKLAQQMFTALILKARPLAVALLLDDDVVLNHKAAAGLKKGDRFAAMTAGQTVIDPSTGVELSGVGGRTLGELEITYFDAAGWAHAKLIDGTLPDVGALLTHKNQGRAASSAVSTKRQLNW